MIARTAHDSKPVVLNNNRLNQQIKSIHCKVLSCNAKPNHLTPGSFVQTNNEYWGNGWF